MLALAALVTGVPQADTTAATAHAHVKPPIDFSSAQGKLHANGVPFIIKGVTWYGGEGPGDLPEGLAGPSAHNIDHYMQLLADAKFNAIRLGFNHQAVLEAKPVLHFDASVEPSLQGKRYVESLVLIVQAAARHNILVTLMCGRLTPEDVPGNGLWYSEKVPEEEVKHSWTQLARGLCGQWNVFAVDLFDEPHGTTWAGTDRSVNWHAASQRLGNHIHSLCSHWLIMVQGARSVSWETGSWYEMTPGENLMGVHEAPVRLTDMSKLVYTPHVAPPSEHMIDAYKASNFPDNMAAVWGRRFGFVSQLTGQALVMGRFGGLLADDHDADFQQAMIGWLSTHQRGYFYDCFNANPTSGGLLHKDWSRLRAEKVRLLEQVPGTDVSRCASNSQTTISISYAPTRSLTLRRAPCSQPAAVATFGDARAHPTLSRARRGAAAAPRFGGARLPQWHAGIQSRGRPRLGDRQYDEHHHPLGLHGPLGLVARRG